MFKFKRNKKQSSQDVYHIIDSKSSFSITEAYKTLRTNIMFKTGDTGCKIITVTSAVPGEGKTTTAVNLAVSFAQTGKRVLLIDADMRKPKVHRFFNIKNSTGLSNILSGIYDEKKDSCISKSVVDNLDVVFAGRVPPNPVELLASDNTETFLKSVENEYDFIIMDTPPINVVTDSLVISKLVTGYVLVVRSNYSEYKCISDAISKCELANAKLFGVVYNGYDQNKKTYGIKYGKYKCKGYYNYYYRTENEQ